MFQDIILFIAGVAANLFQATIDSIIFPKEIYNVQNAHYYYSKPPKIEIVIWRFFLIQYPIPEAPLLFIVGVT